MIRIDEDGKRTEIKRPDTTCRCSAEEIMAALGGRWQIMGQSRDGKYKILQIAGARWQTHKENPEASRLLGRMIFGPALLLEKQNEIA